MRKIKEIWLLTINHMSSELLEESKKSNKNNDKKEKEKKSAYN